MKDMVQMTTSEFVAYVDAERKSAVIAEREACAKVCDMMEWRGRSDEAIWKGDAADECAAAIRARGLTKSNTGE